MANYVFMYSGGKGVSADDAERARSTARWGQWFAELGPAGVDGGAAMGTAKTVGAGGPVSDGGSRGVSGYSIVSADSLDSAVELAKGCPGPRDRRRGRRLRSDRDVAGVRRAESAGASRLPKFPGRDPSIWMTDQRGWE